MKLKYVKNQNYYRCQVHDMENGICPNIEPEDETSKKLENLFQKNTRLLKKYCI